MTNTAIAYDFTELQDIMTIADYKRVKEEMYALKKREEELKKTILARLVGGKLKAGDYNVMLKTTTSRNLDTATLKIELPELWDEYGKDVTKKTLVIA